MRVGVLLGLAALGAVCATAGCQLIAGLGDPIPGVDSGSVNDANPRDAVIKDVKGTDAGRPDTRQTDAPVPLDAPSEGMDSQPTPAYCASLSPSPIFCEDFDEGKLGPWVSITMIAGGALRLSGAYAKSPPASLLVSLDAFDIDGGPDSGSPGWTVNLGSVGTYARMRVGFDFYLPAPLTSSQQPIAIVGLPGVNPNLLIGPGGGQVVGTDGTNISFEAPPVEAWTRVTIDMATTPDGGIPSTTDTMAVYYGSARVCCAFGAVTTPTSFVQPNPDFGLFNQYSSRAYSSAAWTVYFDDITFDGQADLVTPLQPPL
jgi:hypothetical protein